jgi:hypothetical protein
MLDALAEIRTNLKGQPNLLAGSGVAQNARPCARKSTSNSSEPGKTGMLYGQLAWDCGVSIQTASAYRVNGNSSLTQLPGSPFPNG